MPKYQDNNQAERNAPYRSSRRQARKERASQPASKRHLTVRSEKRSSPDIRKIARAVLAMAIAEADRERRAQAGPRAGDDNA